MYDLIGDIHGHADELVRLLERLGYERRSGFYAHPTRKAVFVGDFIDRGPKIQLVLEIVRGMVDGRSALAVMGNHELNAIAYHTQHPRKPKEFLRPHTPKNTSQHEETLLQLPEAVLRDYLAWFNTLPLYLDLDQLRVAHACWDEQMIAVVADGLKRHGGMTGAFVVETHDKATDLFQAVEVILKGKELELPAGVTYTDKDGHERTAMRVKWFDTVAGARFCDCALPPNNNESLPDAPVPAECVMGIDGYRVDAPPVFCGHYWLHDKTPSLLAENVACLDYSVAKDGFLCAYRWDGEQRLSDDKFAWVSR